MPLVDTIHYLYKKGNLNLKKAFSILMIAAMMFPNLTKIGILINFKINQDFIAEVLCINKDKPMIGCNGKCYLSEQLKKAKEQEEKQTPQHSKEKHNTVLFWNVQSFDSSHRYVFTEKRKRICYKDFFHRASFMADIFHPPKLNLT